MLIAYVDESNRGDFTSFGALVASAADTKSLTAALDRVVADAYRSYAIPASAELHGYDLFHAGRDWKGVPPRARISVYRQALESIVRHDVRIILRSTSRARLAARQERAAYRDPWTAEQAAFQFLLQRIDQLARQESTHALVIADIRGDRETQRERFAEYQRDGTPGTYKWTKLDTILDTVHFVPSHHSRMIQAVDLVTFMNTRHRTSTEPNSQAQAATDALYGLIASSGCLFECGSWP